MPKISVIVPVYKVEPYLRRCADSVLNQTFTDFELILVDDGSPDNCPAICDEYAIRDRRVHVIHQENGGLSAARNAGIDWVFANSDSQWFSFIDSDDWVHPEYLERLLNAAVGNHVDISICSYAETTGEEPEIAPQQFESQLWNVEECFVKHRVNATIACGKLYRKSCFQTIRYPVGKLHEDEFTTYKVLFAAKSVVAIPAKMYYYFQNNAGIMRSAWTPQRLDNLSAFSEQLTYFKNNNMKAAYCITMRQFVFAAATHKIHIKNLALSRKESRKYIGSFDGHLKKLLLGNRKYFPFWQYHWCYQAAFPRLINMYYFVKAAAEKIKEVMKKWR